MTVDRIVLFSILGMVVAAGAAIAIVPPSRAPAHELAPTVAPRPTPAPTTSAQEPTAEPLRSSPEPSPPVPPSASALQEARAELSALSGSMLLRPEGAPLEGVLSGGKVKVQRSFSLKPGGCYGAAAAGSSGVALVEVLLSIGATSQPNAKGARRVLLGSGAKCFFWGAPLAMPATLVVVASGTGAVAAQLYSR